MQITSISSMRLQDVSFGKRKKHEMSPEEAAQRQERNKNIWKGVAIGTAGTLVLGGGAQIASDVFIPQQVAIVMPYNENVTDLDKVSQIFDVDENVIEINREEGTMIIPSDFDYLDDLIEEARQDARSPFASEDDVEEARELIEKLLEKKDYQNSTANIYNKGDGYVYFNVHLIGHEDGKISIEQFKKVFDIEDGALAEVAENNIGKDWTIGEYYTVDNSYEIPAGTVLKVDEDDIKTGRYNIDFDYK